MTLANLDRPYQSTNYATLLGYSVSVATGIGVVGITATEVFFIICKLLFSLRKSILCQNCIIGINCYS